MTVRELYEFLEERYPASLSEEWDHDGLMCCPDPEAEVTAVLSALDVTERAIERAVEIGANVILSHHPLIFDPITAVRADQPVGRKLLALLGAGISVISLHTRADAAPGGVNALLATALDLYQVVPFGNGLGRCGLLDADGDVTVADFARSAAAALSSPAVIYGDAGLPVRCVAVVGGSGKSMIAAAKEAGADTLISGRLSYETVNEAGALGINLVEAGHFYTEALLPKRWAEDLALYGIKTEYFSSCEVAILENEHTANAGKREDI